MRRAETSSPLSLDEFCAIAPCLQLALNPLPTPCREFVRALKARAADGSGFTLTHDAYSSHWQATTSSQPITAESFETYKSRVNSAFRQVPSDHLAATLSQLGVDSTEMTVGLSEVPNQKIGPRTYALVWTARNATRVCRLNCNPYEIPPSPAPVRSSTLPNIFRIDELLHRGWTVDNIIDAVTVLDDKLFDGLDDAHKCSQNVIRRRLEEYPNTSRFVLSQSDSLVGYWSIFPLEDPHYRGFRSGRCCDSVLNFGMLPLLEKGGRFNAYFISMCCSKEGGDPFRSRRQLLLSIFDALRVFADDGVFFSEICAHAWSEEGDRLCRGFEMSEIGLHCSGQGRVFARHVYPFPKMSMLKPFDRLESLYNAEFSTA